MDKTIEALAHAYKEVTEKYHSTENVNEKIEYAEYQFKNRRQAEKAHEYLKSVQQQGLNVEDDSIHRGQLRVDADDKEKNKDISQHHNHIMKNFPGVKATHTESVNEKLKGDQHKLDANGNGKIDGDDFKKLRKGKKGEETASMNPKVSTDKTSTEGVKESMTIREKLLSVLEKKENHSPNQDKAEKPEAALKGAGAIQMKADLGPMTPVLDAEKIAADDVKAVDKSSKVSPKNSTDKNAKGDKNIINKPEDVTQKGGFKESFSNLVQAMRDAGQKMYAPKVEEEKTDENYAGNYGSSVASYGKEKDHEKRYEKENPGKKWKDLSWGHQQSHSADYNKNPA